MNNNMTNTANTGADLRASLLAKARAMAEQAAAEKAALKNEQAAKAAKPAVKTAPEQTPVSIVDTLAEKVNTYAGIDSLDAITGFETLTAISRLEKEEKDALDRIATEGESLETLTAFAEVAGRLEEERAALAGLNLPDSLFADISASRKVENASMRGELSDETLGQTYLAGHVRAGKWETMSQAALDALLIVRVAVFADTVRQLTPEKMHAGLAAAGWTMDGEHQKLPHRAAVRAAMPFIVSTKPRDEEGVAGSRSHYSTPLTVEQLDRLLLRGLLTGWIAPAWGDIHASLTATPRRGRPPGSRNSGTKTKRDPLAPLAGLSL